MFEGAHGFFIAFLAVEELADAPRGAEFLEVFHAQHVRLLDVLDAEILVALEQCLENLARCTAVAAQEVAALDALGALAARQGLLVVGDVADEVEVVDVVHLHRLLELVEVDAALREHIGDGLLLLGGVPLVDEGMEVAELAEDVLLGVVDDVLLLQELAACVVDGNRLLHGVDLAAVGAHKRLGRRVAATTATAVAAASRLAVSSLARLKARVLDDGAVPVGVGEESRDAAEVHDDEAALALVVAQARAAADNLLEHRHRGDVLVEGDETHHLAVDTGREQLRRRCDDGRRRGDGDEVAELALAVGVAARDAHDVVRILLHHVVVLLGQGMAHALGGGLIGAEDDGLGHAVGVAQVVGDARSDFADAVFEDDIVVVVGVIVDAVLDFLAEEIELALARTPAIADVRLHVDDAERREEAVVDALPQTVGVDGITEVIDVRDVGRLFRRGRHADLDSRVEVVEDLAPPTVGLG